MTYHEKRLERTLRRIARACSLSAYIGIGLAATAVTVALVELWCNEPYSLYTYITGITGAALTVNAALIGRLVNK